MLYRILAMHKQGTLTLAPSPDYHAIHHLLTNRNQHYYTTGMNVVFDVSKKAQTLVKSDHGSWETQDLYCQVRLVHVSANLGN